MKKIALLLVTMCCILMIGCGKIESSKETSSKISENAENESTTLPTEDIVATPEPTCGAFSSKQKYSDIHREVSILGLKEYKKIKTDKYMDKAKSGKIYLVLFLEVENTSLEKDYFHPDYLSAKVDGRSIKNTFLLNEPERYSTIFTNIEADTSEKGFIVWEVPKNWKKLEVTYNGWCAKDGLTLKSSLTRKDLKQPDVYEEK